MNRWISLDEKLPENDVFVLVLSFDSMFSDRKQFIKIARRFNACWIDDGHGELLYPKYGVVKYWMPLPDIPGAFKKSERG